MLLHLPDWIVPLNAMFPFYFTGIFTAWKRDKFVALLITISKKGAKKPLF